MAQLDARQIGDQVVAGSTPVGSILLWRFDHEIFSMVISSPVRSTRRAIVVTPVVHVCVCVCVPVPVTLC